MTVNDLAGLVLRRWYLYVAVFAAVVVVIMSFGNSPRIYSTAAEVNFDEPVRLPSERQGRDNTETLIDFAGAVVRAYSAEHPNITLSSPNATLFGNGVGVGTSVSLYSVGSQWVVGFNRPTAVIRVAEDRPEAVAAQVRASADELAAIGRRLQRDAGVPEAAMITTSVDMHSTTIGSYGQTRTGKYKGTGVLLVLAFIAATLLAQAFERWLGSRPRRREVATSRQQRGGRSPVRLRMPRERQARS